MFGASLMVRHGGTAAGLEFVLQLASPTGVLAKLARTSATESLKHPPCLAECQRLALNSVERLLDIYVDG